MLLGDATPSVSELGRIAQQAAREARTLLEVLDPPSRARARQVAADEIFAGRRPVLLMVEQDSLCWLDGRLVANRDAETWAEELRTLPVAEQVTADGGRGLRKGLAQVNAQRKQAGLLPVLDQRDHFASRSAGWRNALTWLGGAWRCACHGENQCHSPGGHAWLPPGWLAHLHVVICRDELLNMLFLEQTPRQDKWPNAGRAYKMRLKAKMLYREG